MASTRLAMQSRQLGSEIDILCPPLEAQVPQETLELRHEELPLTHHGV